MSVKFRAIHAIIILFLVTVGSSLTAFIWLGQIEKRVEYDDLVIQDVEYDANSGNMKISIVNGLAVEIPVTSEGRPNEQVVLTIYPLSGKDIGCDFVSLEDLECKGECNTTLGPDEEITLSFSGKRERCILDSEKYHMSIFFGLRAPISTEFRVE